MNRSDAWARFAQCRRLQPDVLQVLVSADIVDALLAEECPCQPYAEPVDGGWWGYRPACHRCGHLGLAQAHKDAALAFANDRARQCPHFNAEEAA